MQLQIGSWDHQLTHTSNLDHQATPLVSTSSKACFYLEDINAWKMIISYMLLKYLPFVVQ